MYTTLMSAGVLFVVWQGGEGRQWCHDGGGIHRLPGTLSPLRQPWLPRASDDQLHPGRRRRYARLRPLLAPPPPLSSEPPGASFRAGHIVGLQEPAPAPPAVPTGPVAVSLQGVTFRYSTATAPALCDIWLDIPAGALVAVTGPVGAGKAPGQGPAGPVPFRSGPGAFGWLSPGGHPSGRARARTGYLPQDPYLFSGTVRDNILLGSATLRQGQDHAPMPRRSPGPGLGCVLCRPGEDLRTFPAGLETEIGELGIRVSGGQRQRIALARALAASGRLAPGLLILDDPFSALDLDTEAQIVTGLRQLFGPSQPYAQQCTIVLFSHRLLAFPQADLVVVLDRGRILEQGTHAELSAGNGLYARIYRAQRLVSTGA